MIETEHGKGPNWQQHFKLCTCCYCMYHHCQLTIASNTRRYFQTRQLPNGCTSKAIHRICTHLPETRTRWNWFPYSSILLPSNTNSILGSLLFSSYIRKISWLHNKISQNFKYKRLCLHKNVWERCKTETLRASWRPSSTAFSSGSVASCQQAHALFKTMDMMDTTKRQAESINRI